jgi:hypothetical protein
MFRFLLCPLLLAVFMTPAVATEWTIVAARANEPMKMDGKLDEAVWQTAQPATGFRQFSPDLNKPAIEETEVRVAYDDEYLYFAWTCFTKNANKLVTLAKYHDDDNSKDDNIDLYLDPLNNKNTCYDIMLTPANVQFDGKIWDNGFSNSNEWDGVWRSGTSVNQDSWIAEIAIPWTTILYDANTTTFAVNFLRTNPAANEGTFWAGTGKFLNAIDDAGTITGLNDLPKPKAWQVIPYAKGLAQQRTDNNLDWELSPAAGADAQYRINSSNTVNATYNPDYAHIEADEEVINLTPNELFLTEKRPFFLDGAEGYRSQFNTWYSRRVTDIDYGGKVNGTIGSFNYGGLGVQLKEDDPNYPENFFGAFNSGFDWSGGNTLKLVGTTREYNEGFSRTLLMQDRTNFCDNWDLVGLGATCQNHHPDAMSGTAIQNSDYLGMGFLGRRVTQGFIGAGYIFLGPKWRDDAGYFGYSDPDSKQFKGVADYTWQINKGIFTLLYTHFEMDHTRYVDNSFKMDSYMPVVKLNLAGHNSLAYDMLAGTDNSYAGLTGEVYHQFFQEIDYTHDVETWWGVGAGWHWGEYYGEKVRQASFSFTLLPFGSLKFTNSLAYVMYQAPDASGVIPPDSWAGNQSLVWNPMQNLFFRLTGRENTQLDHYFFGALGGWTYQPGSTAYIAYNEYHDNPERRLTERDVFIKAGYMFIF